MSYTARLADDVGAERLTADAPFPANGHPLRPFLMPALMRNNIRRAIRKDGLGVLHCIRFGSSITRVLDAGRSVMSVIFNCTFHSLPTTVINKKMSPSSWRHFFVARCNVAVLLFLIMDGDKGI